MIHILFVCLGNICRSPLAEGIFNHLAASKGLGHTMEARSAGTADYHIGGPADALQNRARVTSPIFRLGQLFLGK